MPRHQRSYQRWLVRRYLGGGDRVGPYSILIELLSRKSFYSVVRMDDNRAAEGVYLREEYRLAAAGTMVVIPDTPCSFLEFLIAFSIRISSMLAVGRRTPVNMYFWEMIDRLGLTAYDDAAFSNPDAEYEVDRILDNFMDRNYAANGEGGLFPLTRPHGDQRDVELWYQLNAFLEEHPRFFYHHTRR